MIAHCLADYVMQLIHFQWWKLSKFKEALHCERGMYGSVFFSHGISVHCFMPWRSWPLVIVQCMAVKRHRSSGAFRNWHSLHVILLCDVGLSYLLWLHVHVYEVYCVVYTEYTLYTGIQFIHQISIDTQSIYIMLINVIQPTMYMQVHVHVSLYYMYVCYLQCYCVLCVCDLQCRIRVLDSFGTEPMCESVGVGLYTVAQVVILFSLSLYLPPSLSPSLSLSPDNFRTKEFNNKSSVFSNWNFEVHVHQVVWICNYMYIHVRMYNVCYCTVATLSMWPYMQMYHFSLAGEIPQC